MRILLAILIPLALALPAGADECVMTTTKADVDTGETPEGRFYYHEDCGILKHPCLVMFSIWVYEETNGIDGLQRHDEVHDDTCGGLYEGDTVLL